MLYIISGTSRSGKSFVAKRMMKKCNISYLSLDWLMMGFTNGLPEYGIHDKLWPNEIAEKIWPFLEAMFENMIWSKEDCIIEGEAILPELISTFIKKHPQDIKICFIGYASVTVEDKLKDIYKYSDGANDWLTNESKEYVEDHINNMVEYSKRIKNSCSMYNMAYFDTSNEFKPVIDTAIEYLLKE